MHHTNARAPACARTHTRTCACMQTGSLIQRNAFAEIGAIVDPRLPNGDLRTANTEGLTLRVRGDGNIYTCVLTTGRKAVCAHCPPVIGFKHARGGQSRLPPQRLELKQQRKQQSLLLDNWITEEVDAWSV